MSFRRVISIDLFGKKALENAVKQVERFESDLKKGLDELCRTLLDDGVNVAKAQIQDMNAVYTGALMASIGHGAYDPGSGTGYIYAGAYYAFFVEYGTGAKGAASSHPAGGTTEKGKSYFNVLKSPGETAYERYNKDKDGWYYFEGGRWHYTTGMKSRPFMYNTLMELRDRAESEGAGVIGTYIAGGG